jgi:hypothetical protein
VTKIYTGIEEEKPARPEASIYYDRRPAFEISDDLFVEISYIRYSLEQSKSREASLLIALVFITLCVPVYGYKTAGVAAIIGSAIHLFITQRDIRINWKSMIPYFDNDIIKKIAKGGVRGHLSKYAVMISISMVVLFLTFRSAL